MKVRHIGIIVAALLVLGGCRDREKSITGAYGNAVVTGQVTMASTMANNSPAGVEITVGSTGAKAILGADGRFTFAGVPDGVQLHFRRGSDGIDATTNAAPGFNALELSKTAVSSSSSKRRSTPVSPTIQIEGTITSVTTTGDSIVVKTESRGSFTVGLTTDTVIRKGQTIVLPTDLKSGDQVHVQATFKDTKYTAVQVIVQNGSDDTNGDTNKPFVQIEGKISAKVGTDSIDVKTEAKTFTVALTTNTVIRKGHTTVAPADLKVGQQVHVQAIVKNNTYTALQVIVQNDGTDDSNGDNGSQTATANGIVTATSTSGLVVHTESGKDVTVQVDTTTTIRKYGNTIHLSDIVKGDKVEALGTRVDDQTIKATQIEVQDAPGTHGGH